MTYIIVSLIIYLILGLFFWSMCAVRNRSASITRQSMPKRAEPEASFDDVLARTYSSADGV